MYRRNGNAHHTGRDYHDRSMGSILGLGGTRDGHGNAAPLYRSPDNTFVSVTRSLGESC